jgi:hypothetical protein
VLGVFWVPPTKANGVYFKLSQVISILMVGVLKLIKNVPIVLFSYLVSNKF